MLRSDDKVVAMPPMKEQRKRKTNRRLLLFMLLFFFLVLILVYFQSPFSKVQTIAVFGNQLVETNELLEASGLQKGMSMWQLSIDERVDQAKTIKGVKSVSIEREWPTTVIMKVEEYKRVGYAFMDDDVYAPVLSSGEMLASVALAKVPGDAPLFIDFTESSWLETLGQELAKTDPAVMRRISEITPVQTENEQVELALYMTDGVEVRTSLVSFAEYMQSYLTVARQIDVSQPGVLHMKMSPYFEAEGQAVDES